MGGLAGLPSAALPRPYNDETRGNLLPAANLRAAEALVAAAGKCLGALELVDALISLSGEMLSRLEGGVHAAGFGLLGLGSNGQGELRAAGGGSLDGAQVHGRRLPCFGFLEAAPHRHTPWPNVSSWSSLPRR